MGLRSRTVLAGGCLLAILLGTAYGGIAAFLGRHFRSLEQAQLLRDGALASRGIEREVVELAGKASDWADWDDAYDFMSSRDSEFVRANLDTSVLGNMRLREISFLDFSGRRIAGVGQVGGRSADACPQLGRWLARPENLARIRSGGSLRGWFLEGEEPVLAVALPIRNTSRQGKPAGVLAFVRSFDRAEVRRLEAVFPFGITLSKARSPGVPGQWVLDPRRDSLRAHSLVAGLDGRSLELAIASPLRFAEQRSLLMLWLGIGFGVAAVFFAISGLVLLDRLVLVRLFHLEQDVAGITSGSSLRIHVPGDDEIARLGGNIDVMVESLRRATGELRRTRDLAERAERAKTRLLASVSHEMRTPLNGILGLADLLRRSTTLSAEDMESVDMVAEAGSQLLLTVDTLLDHSQLETGDLELQVQEFSLEEVVALALGDVLPTAYRKGLQVHAEFDPDMPSRLVGDARRVHQLLRILLDNAVKFTVVGEVRLRCSMTSGKAVLLEVADTGIGIDPARFQAIFRPFEQADSGTFFAYGGIGLGLSMVRLLAERMEGRVEVQSRPGKGSLFSVRLGLGAVPGAAAIVDRRRWKGLAGHRVLVAHPSPRVGSILAGILLAAGLDVRTQTSADGEPASEGRDVVLWGFGDPVPAKGVRIRQRGGHERDALACLLSPFLPGEVLSQCANLLRVPRRVWLQIPNAVLRSLVAGILRKAGHEILAPEESAGRVPEVVVVDVREGDADLGERVERFRAADRNVRIVLLLGAFQAVPEGVGETSLVRRPVDPASLLWEVDGWDHSPLPSQGPA